jgi:hypothetical protein
MENSCKTCKYYKTTKNGITHFCNNKSTPILEIYKVNQINHTCELHILAVEKRTRNSSRKVRSDLGKKRDNKTKGLN